MLESDNSIFGDYGIETGRSIPEHVQSYSVANHIRALLDLLQMGHFSVAQGMRNDFICSDEYDEEIFGKVLLLKESPSWQQIDRFMNKEYSRSWREYKEKQP